MAQMPEVHILKEIKKNVLFRMTLCTRWGSSNDPDYLRQYRERCRPEYDGLFSFRGDFLHNDLENWCSGRIEPGWEKCAEQLSLFNRVLDSRISEYIGFQTYELKDEWSISLYAYDLIAADFVLSNPSLLVFEVKDFYYPYTERIELVQEILNRVSVAASVRSVDVLDIVSYRERNTTIPLPIFKRKLWVFKDRRPDLAYKIKHTEERIGELHEYVSKEFVKFQRGGSDDSRLDMLANHMMRNSPVHFMIPIPEEWYEFTTE